MKTVSLEGDPATLRRRERARTWKENRVKVDQAVARMGPVGRFHLVLSLLPLLSRGCLAEVRLTARRMELEAATRKKEWKHRNGFD